MNDKYYYDYNGRRIKVEENSSKEILDKVRYNENTKGRPVSKRKGSKSLRKQLITVLVITSLVGFAVKLSEIDVAMTKEEGTTVTEDYSPSRGPNTVYHGDRHHDLLDVVERYFSEIRDNIIDFEAKFSDDTMVRGQ